MADQFPIDDTGARVNDDGFAVGDCEDCSCEPAGCWYHASPCAPCPQAGGNEMIFVPCGDAESHPSFPNIIFKFSDSCYQIDSDPVAELPPGATVVGIGSTFPDCDSCCPGQPVGCEGCEGCDTAYLATFSGIINFDHPSNDNCDMESVPVSFNLVLDAGLTSCQWGLSAPVTVPLDANRCLAVFQAGLSCDPGDGEGVLPFYELFFNFAQIRYYPGGGCGGQSLICTTIGAVFRSSANGCPPGSYIQVFGSGEPFQGMAVVS